MNDDLEKYLVRIENGYRVYDVRDHVYTDAEIEKIQTRYAEQVRQAEAKKVRDEA